MKDIPTLFTRKEECCGCYACVAVCPKDAVVMIPDEEGFEYPQIDRNKCIGCYLCKNTCPVSKDN